MSDYRSRKIHLPGGREIEIVYIGEAAAAAAEPDAEDIMLAAALSALDDPLPELWMCPGCGSDLVHPRTMHDDGDGAWAIERWCPACDWEDEGVFDQEQVEHFHDALDEGTEELLTALHTMARLNMEDDVERLVHALRRGLIQPMDF
ncbi:MAG: hypothetical protein RIB67_04655 [Miltoncostaeaceae bacterium]